jgi:hypothetical protein
MFGYYLLINIENNNSIQMNLTESLKLLKQIIFQLFSRFNALEKFEIESYEHETNKTLGISSF